MGGNQSEISSIGTTKGEGYRILSVRPNSPLDGQVDVYFDFVIDVVSQKQPQRNPREILEKLTDNQEKRPQRTVKNFQQVITENENHRITLKIVSTKYRNVKSVQITPNKTWNGTEDLIGIETRLERYDEAFETYCPIADIRLNSPVKKGGIVEGEYLIGCREFRYHSINELLENLYDRFYDKTVENKTINFAVYNLHNDQLREVPVLLARGWGDKGLVGCQFLEGHLNRFPKNLASVREQLKTKKKQSDESQRIKKQLNECSGASVQLIESLKAQRNRKAKNFRQLKNILALPSLESNQEQAKVKQEEEPRVDKGRGQNAGEYVAVWEFRALQSRVAALEGILSNVKNYIENIPDNEEL